MIYHRGDLFTNVANCGRESVILHQVNCCGVMGAGIAATVKKRYPNVFESYLNHLGSFNSEWIGNKLAHVNALGTIDVVPVDDNSIIAVVNVFGQVLYGRTRKYTDYDALLCAFEHLRIVFSDVDVEFHFPKLGCGLAGGDWQIVESIIESKLDTSILHCWEK